MFTRVTATALALGCLLASGASAFDRPGALGPGGEIYLTKVGTYGVLFPKGKAYPASNAVLALEVSRSGGVADRILVPGTEGAEVESSPFVIYEETSRSLYLLWQTKISSVNRLVLRSFKDGSFGPPIEVRTGTFNMAMSAPQVAVTRDEFLVPTDDGGTTTFHRMLLHIIWWEESGTAGNRVLYAPVPLIEGLYTGWHPVYSLNDFDRSPDDPAAAAEALPQLYRAPRIQTGRNDHSVVVSFANERNGRLSSLDVTLLPGEVSYIADRIRSHIIEIGRYNPTTRAIADKIRSHIIEIGRLSPQVVGFLSNDVYNHIIDVGPHFVDAADYEGLAGEVSDYATRAASTLFENGRLGEGVNAPAILRLANGDDALGAPRLQVRGVFSQPAPRTAAAPTTIFTSEDGKSVLIAWDTVNQVRYRESSPEGWGEVLVVNLTTELTREKAYEFLEQRLHR